MPILRNLRTLAGVSIDSISITGATTCSEEFAVDTADEIGLMCLNGPATATGTTPAVTFSLEMSPDGGDTWFNSPIAVNTTTQAQIVIASLTPALENFYFPYGPLAPSGSKSKPLYRWVFTWANADNTLAKYSMWLSVRNRNSWRQ